jgi:hypothetical protein
MKLSAQALQREGEALTHVVDNSPPTQANYRICRLQVAAEP